jgi:hypothetical protein
MFGHRFLRLVFIGATSNAFPISKNEPLMKANFPDDVLGHCERPVVSRLQLTPAGLLVY